MEKTKRIDALKLFEALYYSVYTPLIETEHFSVLYDNEEEEWFYIIDENITFAQLVKARSKMFRLLIALVGIDNIHDKVKPYTVGEFIDNNDKMMRDKSLFNLYRKFNFMFPSYVG